MSKIHYRNWQGWNVCGKRGEGYGLEEVGAVTCSYCLKKLPKAIESDQRHFARWADAIFLHPVTGERAGRGRAWVRSIFGDWCQESPDTPWTSSVQSETYWSS